MRLFFAVPIPEETSARIAAERKRVVSDALRWVDLENQHFTLHFLGEVAEERLEGLISAGSAVAAKHQPFFIQISGAGFFPNQNRPRIFWIGTAEGTEKLAALAKDLSGDRPFWPHLTVVRIKKKIPAEIMQQLERWKDKDFGSFLIDRFLLMESRLFPEGAVYCEIHSFPLNKKD